MKYLKAFLKIFTHNYCDMCGFIKDETYVVEYFSEGGLILCKKCFNKLHTK